MFPLHQLNAIMFFFSKFLSAHCSSSSSSPPLMKTSIIIISHKEQWLLKHNCSATDPPRHQFTFHQLKRQYQHKSFEIHPTVGGIFLIMSPLKYECVGCICNNLSCVLSGCTLSSLLFLSKDYLPGNRGSSILKSSAHRCLYHHARNLVSSCCICQTSIHSIHSILEMEMMCRMSKTRLAVQSAVTKKIKYEVFVFTKRWSLFFLQKSEKSM